MQSKSNHTSFDEHLLELERNVVEALKRSGQSMCNATPRQDFVDYFQKFTPLLIQQMHQTHEQIHDDLEKQDAELAENMAAMEEADAPLLLQWSQLCEQANRLQDKSTAPSTGESWKREWLLLLQQVQRLVKKLRAREAAIAACHMSVCQREQSIG